MTKICLLGASGSIGRQSLDVMKKNRKDFCLLSFSVGKKTYFISHILKAFPEVKAICIQDNNKISYYSKKYPSISFFSNDDGLIKLIDFIKVDMVINALVGFVGLKPTLHALNSNLKVSLANKESLVVGGELINRLLAKGKGIIYPIDSEHNALWKCLKVDDKNVKKMYLTASGGAFRNLTREELNNVNYEMALNHPTWRMGPKITIDCATMVNKAFEIIEAHYLYNYPFSQIGIKLHDESYLHSYLEYLDGSFRGDISKPDMRNPIKFALYEGKIPFTTFKFNNFNEINNLHFHDFDINRYPLVKYAEKVIDKKGVYGAVFNASNEAAVYAFLKDEIAFLDIEKIVSKCMDETKNKRVFTYEDLLQIHKNTTAKVQYLIKERKY